MSKLSGTINKVLSQNNTKTLKETTRLMVEWEKLGVMQKPLSPIGVVIS